MKSTTIIEAVLSELLKADTKHPPMDGEVEGLYTLKCEVMELEREIKRRSHDESALVHEAIQVAAMAIKFLRDCCDMDLAHQPVDEMRYDEFGPICYPDLAEDKTEPEPGISIRGQQWQMFSDEVLHHIETYTVPQYGDQGEDRASDYTLDVIKEHIGRYRDRIGTGARGESEAVRDFIKMAHYCCLGFALQTHDNVTATIRRKPEPPG